MSIMTGAKKSTMKTAPTKGGKTMCGLRGAVETS